MSFLTGLALFVGLFVVAPYVAHRLRRRRGEERPFAATHLVPPAPPRARRRAELEDPALFAVRALSVLALALLGASPLVRCSRLSLNRASGASVALAIVIDDSMSMRADAGGQSRFERARRAALELLASSRDGDAVAIVAAGAPPRVALAATGDVGAARSVIESLSPTDRATDLDGAINVARGLVAELPQVDRRIVLLSDLADGRPSTPLASNDVPLWAPLRDLAAAAADCAVVSADRVKNGVRARLACGPEATAVGRAIEIVSPDKKVVATAPVSSLEVFVPIPDDVGPPLTARLTGADAIASDDAAPVALEASLGAVAVVVERSEGSLPTGGAPAVEQALLSLKLDIATRPLPVVPDRAEDLASFVALLVDDPPGFTPEQRKALRTFVEEGGVLLVALGPRAAAAPLGSSFDPLLERGVTWQKNVAKGVDIGAVKGSLAEAAASYVDFAPPERSVLASTDRDPFEVLLPWSDGAPLVAKRTLGRGEAWIVTLPFGVDASDLPLRPGFLPLLDAWIDAARVRVSDRRTAVGEPWVFVTGGRKVDVRGPGGASVRTAQDGVVARVVPESIGAYDVDFGGGRKEQRIASAVPGELDLRPRKVAESASQAGLGDTKATVDVSWAVALVLLVLTAVELVARILTRRGETPHPTP